MELLTIFRWITLLPMDMHFLWQVCGEESGGFTANPCPEFHESGPTLMASVVWLPTVQNRNQNPWFRRNQQLEFGKPEIRNQKSKLRKREINNQKSVFKNWQIRNHNSRDSKFDFFLQELNTGNGTRTKNGLGGDEKKMRSVKFVLFQTCPSEVFKNIS